MMGTLAATFTCRVKGHPLPKVTWTHQGSALVSSHHYTVLSEGDRHSLHILNPVERDAGEYVCHVTNAIGSATAACSLTFTPDPMTLTDPEASSVKVKERGGSPHPGHHDTQNKTGGSPHPGHQDIQDNTGSSPHPGHLDTQDNTGESPHPGHQDTQDNTGGSPHPDHHDTQDSMGGSPHPGQHDTQNQLSNKDFEPQPHETNSELFHTTTTSLTSSSTRPDTTTITTTTTTTRQSCDVRPREESPNGLTSVFKAGIRPGSVRKRRDWFEQRSSPSVSPDRAPRGHAHPSPAMGRHKQTGSREASTVSRTADRRGESDSGDVLAPATYQIKATPSSTDKTANDRLQSPQRCPTRPQSSPGREGQEGWRTTTLHTPQADVAPGDVDRYQHGLESRAVQTTVVDSDNLRSLSPGRVDFRSVLRGHASQTDHRSTQATERNKSHLLSVLPKTVDRRDTTGRLFPDTDHTVSVKPQGGQHVSDVRQTSGDEVMKECTKPVPFDSSFDTPDEASLIPGRTHNTYETEALVSHTMTSTSPQQHYVTVAEVTVSQPGPVADPTVTNSRQDQGRQEEGDDVTEQVEGCGKEREASALDHGLQDCCEEVHGDDLLKGQQDLRERHWQAPTVQQALQDQRVRYGGQVVMQCAVSGHPSPHITWTVNNKNIKPSRFFQLSYQEPLAQLLVAEAYSEDEGEYTCTATNSVGTNSSSCYLTVADDALPAVNTPHLCDVSTLSASPRERDASISDVSRNIIESSRSEEGARSGSDDQTSRHPLPSDVTKTSSVTSASIPQPVTDATRSDVTNHVTADTSLPESHHVTMDQKTPLKDQDSKTTRDPVVLKADRKFEDDYDCLRELGKGKFGSVYECREKRTGRLFAAKVLKVRGGGRKEEVMREVEVMNNLCHPKLLLLHDAFHSNRTMVLVTEFVGGGELLERVCGEDYVLTEADCVHYLRQLCEGVAYIHARGVVHLDLKPNNVLCVSPHTTHIKIIDFGLARFYAPGDTLHVLFGTPEFVAPEVINYDPVGFSTDLWSVGVICYILLSGLSPFLGDNDAETLANVTRGDYDFDDECFDVISDKAKDFITCLLVKRKESRLSADDCSRHAWLSEADTGLGSRRLNTEKLRSFVAARRKLWHKTGQAIIAMQRMASLGKSVTEGSTLSHHDSPTTTTTPPAMTPIGHHDVEPEVTEPCSH